MWVAIVLLHRIQVKLLKTFGIVEARPHRIAFRRVLVEDSQIQLLGHQSLVFIPAAAV